MAQRYDNAQAEKNREGLNSLFFNVSLDKSAIDIFNNHNAGKESTESAGIHWDTTADKYTQSDGSITKGGLLIAVLNANIYLTEGETRSWGKGHDRTLS